MLSFRPEDRMRSKFDFEAIFAVRRSVSNSNLIVYGRKNSLENSRLGLSVSKKLAGNAIVRNRLRRRIKEAYRLLKPQLPKGLDLVVIPRSKIDISFEQLQSDLLDLAKQLERRLNRDQPSRP
jgi:ribonuclease P protein component